MPRATSTFRSSSANEASRTDGGAVVSAPAFYNTRGVGAEEMAARFGVDPVAGSGVAATVFPLYGRPGKAVGPECPFFYCSTSITTVGDIRTITTKWGDVVSTYQCGQFFDAGHPLQEKYKVLASTSSDPVGDVALELFAVVHLLYDLKNFKVNGRQIFYEPSSLAAMYTFTDSCNDIISGKLVAGEHVRRCLIKIVDLIEQFKLDIMFHFG